MAGITNQNISVLTQPYVNVAMPSNAPVSDAMKARADEVRAQLDAFQKQLDQKSAEIANLPRNMDAEQKAVAVQKVQRIKDQIKMLMMMGGIGNPRDHARQIAQLAKELAAAVHEYATAGGSDSAAEHASSGSSAIAITPGPDRNSASPVDADASAHAAKAVGTAAETSANSSVVAQDNSQQPERMQSMAAGLQQKNDISREDQEFIEEVRNVAAQLRALAKLQEARLSKTADQTGVIAKMHQALGEIEKNISGIGAPDVAPSVSINLFA